MKILYINIGMHIKNDHALKSYKNINLYVTNNIEILNIIDLKQFDCVYSPCFPIDVSKYPNTKFLFGPHFSVFPEKHQMDIIRSNNVIYIHPSEWAAKVWEYHPFCKNIKVLPLPFGVDTDKFSVSQQLDNRENIFIYFKDRNPEELNYLCNYLNDKNLKYIVFSYKNRYNEQDYINYLQNSKYGIWLGRHESQGFALEEALSCNVPLLVWNVTSMNQEYKSNYSDISATTIPYWDERCGEFFYKKEELNDSFILFESKLDIYKPREYILENLTIDKCEEKLINLIKNNLIN
jgi:hypothetical protein